MNLIDAVKEESIHVSFGDNWIYFDKNSLNWVVLTRHYRARINTVLYDGSDEEEAVRLLLKG
mgnify:FL=1